MLVPPGYGDRMGSRRIPFHDFIRIWGRRPVERWEFRAADPHNTFQITLGRMPEGCEHGNWSVNATNERDPIICDTEQEARSTYRAEASRLQQVAGPGNWRQLNPEAT